MGNTRDSAQEATESEVPSGSSIEANWPCNSHAPVVDEPRSSQRAGPRKHTIHDGGSTGPSTAIRWLAAPVGKLVLLVYRGRRREN